MIKKQVEVKPLENFYEAEEHHQDYFKKESRWLLSH